MSACLIAGSRLGVRFGRRRVLLAGIGGFVAVSTLCALAPSAGLLIVGRAVQGVCAAIMVPQGFGLIGELFATRVSRRRSRSSGRSWGWPRWPARWSAARSSTLTSPAPAGARSSW